MSRFDEEPDGDPHGECALEIVRLQSERDQYYKCFLAEQTEHAKAIAARDNAERELASLRAEKERAEAEVARLNQWADSFTDAHLKERQTGDALVKEVMQRALKAEAERDAANAELDQTVGAIKDLLAERDAALKDAERYRFLCEGDYRDDGEMWTAISNTSIKDEWDAEIDAAIAARKGEQ